MAENPTPTDASMTAGTRCVVLTGASGMAPADLLAGLSHRGVNTVVVSDPAAVMVEMARQKTGVLVVVHPDKHPWLKELADAIRAYHPRCVRWGYDESENGKSPRLYPLNEQSACVIGQVEAGVDGPVHSETRHPGYLVPDPKSPLGRAQAQIPRERVRSLVVKVQEGGPAHEPLISEEELAMLLGPMPEDPDQPAGKGERP